MQQHETLQLRIVGGGARGAGRSRYPPFLNLFKLHGEQPGATCSHVAPKQECFSIPIAAGREGCQSQGIYTNPSMIPDLNPKGPKYLAIGYLGFPYQKS